ncbi:hypothetical protein H072_9080 [Dactylellina haptotyla CBS 200.50]|uniref:F-box domain-containing protein n=1 Tax=Dactylellina haptotyla (strain CBS 200.50) TaxID=1284197 RepID=S8A7Y3_DACHA|nr:hypothetical protein H072_9080 [Dactylellina haptotyla CBS 200.50]
MSSSFDSLPPELATDIAQFLPNSSLKSLMRCSQKLYSIYSSFLYASLELSFLESLESPTFRPRTLSWAKDRCLQHVKHVRFIDRSPTPKIEDAKTYQDLVKHQVYPFIKRLPLDRILTFDWNPGLGIAPCYIFDCFQMFQNLQKLAIPLATVEFWDIDDLVPVKLTQLTHLRLFRVPRTYSALKAARILVSSAEKLKHLRFECCEENDKAKVNQSRANNLFRGSVSGLNTEKLREVVGRTIYRILSERKLQSLYIENVPIHEDIAPCLTNRCLEELTLRNISNLRCLHEVFDNHSFKLRTLHILAGEADLYCFQSMIRQCLEDGLEELTILSTDRWDSPHEVLANMRFQHTLNLRCLAVGRSFSHSPELDFLQSCPLQEISFGIVNYEEHIEAEIDHKWIRSTLPNSVRVIYLMAWDPSDYVNIDRGTLIETLSKTLQTFLRRCFTKRNSCAEPMLRYIVLGNRLNLGFTVQWARNRSPIVAGNWLPVIDAFDFAAKYDKLNENFRLYNAVIQTGIEPRYRLPSFR